MWKNEQFAVTQEKLRQINSLVFSLVKTSISRNFCQRSVTVDFRNFHTMKNVHLFFSWNWSSSSWIIATFSENHKNHEENVEDFKSNPECLIYVKLFHCPNFECTAKSPSEKTIQKHFEEIHGSKSNVWKKFEIEWTSSKLVIFPSCMLCRTLIFSHRI